MMETLCHHIVTSSLCALGQTAPNPVLSTLNFFKDEYLAHIVEKRCPAGVCKAMLKYVVVAEKCIGCTICAKNCPAECISGAVKQVHEIVQENCVKCGVCKEKCKFDAIIIE